MDSLLGKKKKEPELLDQCCPKLTYKQRLYGFIGCSVLGWIVSIIGFFQFKALIDGEPAGFAICYSMGNLICIFSTCFLSGPKKQSKSMIEKGRLITVIVFFVSLVGTICFACINPIRSVIVCIIFVIIQFCAYFWYTLSYIPLGQRIFKKFCKGMCDEEKQ